MAEPFKNLFNEVVVDKMIAGILPEFPAFDKETFKKDVFASGWEEKELKERMYHISEQLGKHLPDDYRESLRILKAASPGLEGIGHMCFPDFVERFGIEDFEGSVEALEYLTRFSSSEFAVRPFIMKYGEKMIEVMHQWALSENEHVRRLASEGSRSRLPWAIALPEFKRDPSPVLPILEQLKDDESEYVRKSVANNLNDISKDNPQILLDIAKSWIGDNTNRDKLVKHACRTLLKAGSPEALSLFGYSDTRDFVVEDFNVQDSVVMEEYLPFSFTLKTRGQSLGKIRLEYAIDFVKKNGKRTRKVFKISEAQVDDKVKKVDKKHSFKTVTTRVHYVGIHMLTIIINGIPMGTADFELKTSP